MDRLWVNADRTVLVRLWANGVCEVATREAPDHTWGPPVYLAEEHVAVLLPDHIDKIIREHEAKLTAELRELTGRTDISVYYDRTPLVPAAEAKPPPDLSESLE